jgi:hypothetical protein
MAKHSLVVIALSCVGFAGCGDEGGSENTEEVITTVVLNFEAPVGPTITATWNDPDGDGGAGPTIDPINLTAGTYTMTVEFQNRLANPQEDITAEVSDESDAHLVLVTGTAVVGPATNNATGPLMHSYGDTDANSLPIGLTNTVVARAGTGQLTVTLRHMPPEEPPVKGANTVMEVKTGGLDSIGGSTDVQVNYNVTVQ